MFKRVVLECICLSMSLIAYNRPSVINPVVIDTLTPQIIKVPEAKEFSKQFTATCDFVDAAINSLNSFNGLIKKENYRIKITAFNNPTSSEMGFNLENEIQSALKPLLAKAKNTNTNKFSQVITSIVSGVSKTTTPL